MKNIYIPNLAVIKGVKEETPDVKTFKISPKNGPLNYLPGQFIELTVFGYGEFPTSISSSPEPKKNHFEVTVKKIGDVTNMLHQLKIGSTVGVRGPFGKGFPLSAMKKKDVMIIGGGVGLAPLRSLILYLLANRKNYCDLKLLYGSRTSDDLLFKDEMKHWDMEICLTVDRATEGWTGNVGLVTTLFKWTEIKPESTVAVLCGPPIMIKVVSDELLKMDFPEDRIIVSLERMMKCGMGMCGHCNIGAKYVCKDGPVFTYGETMKFLEAGL
jgi:sulfhydrogenase subunit gamma (sulfur reductase)